MAQFKLRRLWEDSDGMVQIELSASNGLQSTNQDFFAYPDDIEAFGESLASYFPKLGEGEVTFKCGDEAEKIYSYVFVKAFYITASNTGLLIQTNNNKVGHQSALSRFCIESTLHEVNKLGTQISRWAKAMHEPMICEIQPA